MSRPIAPYHSGSVCTEDLTPDWTETHKTFNRQNPAAAGPNSPMDGFVALAYARGLYATSLGVHMADQNGHRAIGFFDASDLNYYYFIASQFGMSDNMFGPVPTETPTARAYSYAATSQGFLHDIAPGTLTAKTIFESLDQKGISWKLYAAEGPSAAFLKEFAYFNKPGVSAHIASVDQYRSDAQAGTLPNVAFIETGLHIGISEHTSNFDPAHPELGMVPINVQTGQAWAGGLINALLTSPNWKDSVMFFVYDESGGLFDHVPPLAVVSPDGVKPVDFRPNDVPGDFTITGGRVPNAVISPFSKKNYVSHTAADYTAGRAELGRSSATGQIDPATRKPGGVLSGWPSSVATQLMSKARMFLLLPAAIRWRGPTDGEAASRRCNCSRGHAE